MIPPLESPGANVPETIGRAACGPDGDPGIVTPS